MQAEEKFQMTQLHNQCLAEKCELEKEMKYLQVDQQDMRSSVYQLQQRMNFLKKNILRLIWIYDRLIGKLLTKAGGRKRNI